MSEVKFEREPRYLVIKLSKLDGGYASGCIYPDAKLAKKIEKLAGSALVDCVVVEADWPEYEPVWGMLERRTTGQPASDFDAQRLRADTAEAELVSANADKEAYAQNAIDLRKRAEAAERRIAELQELLRLMTNDYACCLEAGHDRITFLGGDCDSVSKMLADNVNYAKACAALNPNPEAESHE